MSVAPVMALVWLLHLAVAPLDGHIWRFTLGGGLLILGLAIFLLGADLGVVPIGQRAGSALTSRRNLPFLLCSGFVIGFMITIAEPDVHVLAQQVSDVAPQISRLALVSMIALGVGFFVAFALLRIVLQIPLRTVLLVCYGVLFACAFAGGGEFLGIAFDAGGATTGPMTVPFIMSLGIGVAAVRAGGGKDDSFGLIGVASIGPVLAVLIMGMFGHAEGSASLAADDFVEDSLFGHFWELVPEVATEVGMAVAPLVILFALFRGFLLRRMTRYRLIRTCVGLAYTYLGLVIFFVGVKGGFIATGASLGGILALGEGGVLLFLTGLALGALAVLAEPAVWVLTAQVEQVSGGAVKSRLILLFLCAGVSLAVGFAMFRVAQGLSLWYFLIPGYALALGMTFFCPPLFTAIAFDSGGVASGPMASTFILAFTLGASASLGGNPITDAFGVIALIAMTPLIAIQALGLIYARKARRARNEQGNM